MSSGIKNQIGPYRYADDALGEKSFGGRLFKIVIAGAFDAGIVGSECNGIVILDENNESVVLDEHFKEVSGYNGPSARQKAEFKRIMDMDWPEFSKFCRENPRFRENSGSDFHKPKPDKFTPPVDRVIYPANVKQEGEENWFPLDSRREMIEFILQHDFRPAQKGTRLHSLAWNIKVRDFDFTENPESAGTTPDPKLDEEWASYAENNASLFWEACEGATANYVEGEFSTPFADDLGDYGFAVSGRNRGWLVLTFCEGISPISWETLKDVKSQLHSLSDEDLIKMYRLVASVDRNTSPEALIEEMGRQYSFLREDWEEARLARATP